MNEEECRLIYQQLINMLRELGIFWVVELVNEEINIGTIISRNTPDLDVREYTHQERLKILISLIKQSIVDRVLMEEKVINFFNHDGYFSIPNIDITFSSDTDERSFNINYDGLDSKIEQANSLLILLERIIEDIVDDTER